MKKIAIFIPVLLWLVLFLIPSCQKEISPEPVVQDSTFIAGGSLKDSNNICFGNTVYGTFYNGITPGGNTAYISLQVNVINAGSYKISTDIQNGFQFADSGVFAATGLTTIQLKPVGTPLMPRVTDFLIIFDTSFCFATVEVKDSTGTGLGAADTILTDTWKFTHTGFGMYEGDISSATFSTLATQLFLTGAVATGDTIVQINIAFPTPEITPGIYTTADPGNSFVFNSSTSTLYKADTFTGTNVMTFEISSYNTATKVVSCNFSGNAQDVAGNTIPISKGEFKATVQ